MLWFRMNFDFDNNNNKNRHFPNFEKVVTKLIRQFDRSFLFFRVIYIYIYWLIFIVVVVVVVLQFIFHPENLYFCFK